MAVVAVLAYLVRAGQVRSTAEERRGLITECQDRELLTPYKTAHLFKAVALEEEALRTRDHFSTALVALHLLALAAVVVVGLKTPYQHTFLAPLAVHRVTSLAAPQAPLAARSMARLAPTPCALLPVLVAVVGRLMALRPRQATAAQAAHPEAVVEAVVLASTQ